MKTQENAKAPVAWRNRIVAHGEEEPGRLLANPNNWRSHPKAQQTALAGVLEKVGWVQDVIVNRTTGFVLDGHARIELAVARGEKVPVVYVELTAEEEALVLATLDPLSAMAGTNKQALASLMAGIPAEGALAGLVGDLRALAGIKDPLPPAPDAQMDRAETLQRIWQVQPGQVWEMGAHRLVCGDATSAIALAAATIDGPVDCIFTDPPYNVDYEGYTEDNLKIAGDKMTGPQFESFLTAAFRTARSTIKPTGSLYVCHASIWQREFQAAIEAAGFQVRCQIIWAKNTFAWGFGRYKFQHEPIFYAHVAGESDAWYGDKSQSTLWQVDKPAANREHPTMKPVELVERALVNSSKTGDLVLDPFGGSGSTLVACQRLGRAGRAVEIDPKYCAVILERLKAMGLEPKLAR
jgi:DNA modification methylase